MGRVRADMQQKKKKNVVLIIRQFYSRYLHSSSDFKHFFTYMTLIPCTSSQFLATTVLSCNWKKHNPKELILREIKMQRECDNRVSLKRL